MDNRFPLFLIPLIPLRGAAFNLLCGKRAGKGVVTMVGCGAIAVAALIATKAVWLLGHRPTEGHLSDTFFNADWMFAGGDQPLKVAAGLMLDRLSSVLVLIVTWIALLIHIYATGYMEHEPDFARFFGYLNLFTGSMLILVLGDSLPVTFVG